MEIEVPVVKTLKSCIDTIIENDDRQSAVELCKQIKRWLEEKEQ